MQKSLRTTDLESQFMF